jgi:hypothetical protein
MWLWGWVLIGLSVLMVLTNQWFVDEIFDRGIVHFNLAMNLWSLVLGAAMPLGVSLLVGSIIVRRLPEAE